MTDHHTLDTPDSDAAPRADDPSRFGAYQLVRKLGEGGMGVVYEARKVGLDRRVALKVLTYFDGQAATRFLQEARLVASIDHPNVVTCIDLGQHEGVPYLAMEYLDGETLRARMNRGPMRVDEAVDLLLPVISALAAAHDRDIVHRDIKPENIFLARQLREVVPKVLDFGVAKRGASTTGPGITHTSAIIGTPGYMAPEQAIDAKRVTPASDQFALGAVLWGAVAGESLYPGDVAIKVLFAVVNEAPRSLHAACPSLPADFCDAVMRMVAREPEQRFASLREVGRALLPFASAVGRARWHEEFEAALGSTVPVPRPPAAPAAPAPVVSLTSLGDTVRPPATMTAERPTPPSLDAARPRRWPLVAAAAAVVVAGISYAAARFDARTPAPPREAAVPPTPLAAPSTAAPPAHARPEVAAPLVGVAVPPEVAAPHEASPTTTPRPSTMPSREPAPHAPPHPRLRHRNL